MSDRVVQPSEPAFTVVLRGKHFELSDTQIRFDSPNKFTGVFLGGNGGTDIMYSDRRPEYFPIISEWLAGYEDMFPIHLEGMSEQVATRAILAEAEHFKLKKLAARLKTALDRAEPLDQPLMWPFTGSQEGTFFRVRPVVHEFADIVKKYPDGVPREVFEARPTASAQFYWFHDLQVRSVPGHCLTSFRVRELTIPAQVRLPTAISTRPPDGLRPLPQPRNPSSCGLVPRRHTAAAARRLLGLDSSTSLSHD